MPLVWRNLITYAWIVHFKKFLETLSLFQKLHWLKGDNSTKGKEKYKRSKAIYHCAPAQEADGVS